MRSANSPPILIVAGESSGDQHAAGLVRELQNQLGSIQVEFFGSGGEQLRREGAELFVDVSQLGAIGPGAALFNLLRYWKLYRQLQREAQRRKPRLAILVDFPDFNLRLAPRLARLGIPLCYFISPQIWAWRPSRVKQIRRYVDLMLVIFPFEEEFYRKHGVVAYYIGNPTAGRLAQLSLPEPQARHSNETARVALMPGSRVREVKQIFPIQLDAARYLNDRIQVNFRVAQAPAISGAQLRSIYEEWSAKTASALDLEIWTGGTDELLPQVDAAVVKSGTSTLEAMLMEVPFAMVYKVSWPSWVVLRPLVGPGSYCLANLVAGETVAPEFVQHNARGDRIGKHLLSLLQDQEVRKRVLEGLYRGRERLGSGNAYRQGALRIRETFFEESE